MGMTRTYLVVRNEKLVAHIDSDTVRVENGGNFALASVSVLGLVFRSSSTIPLKLVYSAGARLTTMADLAASTP
jgi:hypothetical protein